MDKKSILIFLAIIAVLSVAANVYSFGKLSNEESEINKKNGIVLSKKDEEITSLKEQIEILKSKKETFIVKETSEEKEEIEQINEEIEVTKITELANAAERFIDYTFNVNEENYATVKNNAKNYMTEEMMATLFASDGISEDEMNLTTTVEEIEVFTADEDEGKAIVQYEINLDYGNGYKENLKPFVLLYFVSENGKLKVSEIQAINDIGGI